MVAGLATDQLEGLYMREVWGLIMKVSELFERYKATREYQNLAINSKRSYNSMMKLAVDDYFLVRNRITQITEEFVDTLYEKLCNKGNASYAGQFMRVMRRIWSVARRKKWVKSNPFREMRIKVTKPREVVWTKEQVNKLLDAGVASHQYGLAATIALCYYLAQRPGDMMFLKREAFNNDFTEVRFIQQKTGKAMRLPVMPELAKYVKAALSANGDVIYDKSSKALNVAFRELKRLNLLPISLQIRDLRRTALVEFMENGATDAEGQSWSGHANRDMLNTYAPSTITMARNAMQKRFGNTA